MSYEIYKMDLEFEDYFNTWSSENLKHLTDDLKEQIHNKYKIKCEIFKRDNYECQNVECKALNSPLTLHHIKFKKNGGEDKVRNGVTLCRSCHQGFHRGKKEITFKNNTNLPAHICGRTYVLTKPEVQDWKKIRKEMLNFRKTLKQQHGINISWKEISILMKFLTVPYNEWDD